jgi:uroporphyrinogen decarboxylase
MNCVTSKQRIINAIKHEESDKVPVDLGGSVQSTIHAYTYSNLKKALGINSGNIEIMDSFTLTAKVEDPVRDVLKIDTVPILPPFDALGVRNDCDKKDWQMPNGLKVKVSNDFNPEKQEDGSYLLKKGGYIFKLPKNGYYFDTVKYLLQDATTIRDIDNNFDFTGYTNKEAEYFKKEAEKLKNSDKAVVGDISASFSAEDIFGYEKAFINLILEKNITRYFIERLTDMFIKNFDVFYNAVGDVTDIMMLHKDMGVQLGVMISPTIAREIFFPNFKRFISHIKKRSKYYVMMHNCGSIYEFMPDLIECGIDIINPVQITAKNMEPQKLKKEFGKYICFWGGGVDTQHVLPFGDIEEVRKQVRENAIIFSKGGGFVFTPVHCIQANVPLENIIAAFDEINRFKV